MLPFSSKGEGKRYLSILTMSRFWSQIAISTFSKGKKRKLSELRRPECSGCNETCIAEYIRLLLICCWISTTIRLFVRILQCRQNDLTRYQKAFWTKRWPWTSPLYPTIMNTTNNWFLSLALLSHSLLSNITKWSLSNKSPFFWSPPPPLFLDSLLLTPLARMLLFPWATLLSLSTSSRPRRPLPLLPSPLPWPLWRQMPLTRVSSLDTELVWLPASSPWPLDSPSDTELLSSFKLPFPFLLRLTPTRPVVVVETWLAMANKLIVNQ